MNSIVGDRYIAELVQIFEQQGSALYTGQHSLCLTVPCLHYIQRKVAAVHEATGSPLPAQFTHLQQLQESFSRIMVLKLITDKHFQLSQTTTLSLEPFKAVHSLILKKIPLIMITGLSRLRSQIRSLVIQRCGLESMEEVIVRCGGDDSASFSWACLKEVDFSHNAVGQLGESLQFLTAIEKMDLSNNVITDDSTGIEYIDSVTYLHLGFNQLKSVPRFGPRAKFNLTGLNLRNNQLSTLEGLQELDSLTDLDLTDNLLTLHTDLKPLQNLHNLCLLSLIGNPLSFHPKHRLKSVEVLSNLINPTTFRLDSKKLTSNERKAIPRSLTHFPRSSPSLNSHTSSQSPLHNHTFTPPPNAHLISGSSPGHHSDAIVISKRRRKKLPAMRVVPLHDPDKEQDSVNDSGTATDTPSSVPLKYERRLQRMKDLAKQMPDKWLLSNASLDTTSSENNQMARGASQPRAAQEHHPLDPASLEADNKATGDSRMQRMGSGKKKVKNRESADIAVVEPRTSTPIMMLENDGVSGECFLVERYESDVEEGCEEGDQILLTLSDRFLEEKDTNGVTLDRMDLGCLMTAEVEKKAWKSAQQSEVLVLQFSHERRDRRKREYVMIEQNHDSIIDILAPISEENQKAFSLASKVEELMNLLHGMSFLPGRISSLTLLVLMSSVLTNYCFTCQRVFDATESKLMPLLNNPQPAPLPQSHSLGHQRTSLANRFCPFCKSQRLQYTSNAQSFKPLPALSTSASPRIVVRNEHSLDSTTTAGQDGGSVNLGFVVSGDADSAERVSNPNSHQTPDSRGRSSAFINGQVCTGESGSLDNDQSYDQGSGANSGLHNDVHESSEYLVPPERDQRFSTSSWSFGELSGNQAPQCLRSSHDVLYHSDNRDNADMNDVRHDTRDTGDSRCDTRDTGDSRLGTRDTDDSKSDTGYDTQKAIKQRYNTVHGSDHRPGDMNELSCSGGKSNRLTNSEPIPKLQPFTEVTQGYEDSKQQSREFGQYSSSEQPTCKPRNPFEEEGMSRHRSSELVSSLSRMKLHQGSLGSVQEQPASSLQNPFDESCSTNPFDEEESATNPFDMEGDECDEEVRLEVGAGEGEREGEGWSEVKPKDRGHSFSRNEERYFTYFKSHRTVFRAERNEDLEIPVPRRSHHIQTSSSVPETSYLDNHMAFGSSSHKSHDYRLMPNKSSTLPCGRSRTSPQESPALSKRSTTLPRGKPPIYGGLVRGKSMESLNRSSPKNEQHPIKSNRIFPSTSKRGKDPFGHASRTLAGKEGELRLNGDPSKPQRNHSTPPSMNIGNSGSGKSTPELERGYSLSFTQSMGRGSHAGSHNKLTRMTSAGDIRYTGYSSAEKGRGSSSGERDRRRRSQEKGRGRSSADESRTSSRSSRRGSGGWSSSGGLDSHRVQKLSSSESSSRPLSTSVLIKDEDPCYIHHSLNLHLDMEVFSTEHGEHFKMIFKTPIVRYKSAKEVPAVAIFSNINAFIYRITAPQSSQPDKWLSLQHTLPLSKLVYMDVGPFHQFLRLEFSIPGACLTFLLRDKDRCRECLTILSLIVSDCPRSSFKSVGICPFRLETISHPDRALRGAIMKHYDNIKTSSSKSRGEGRSEESDGVKLYMLAHRHIHMPGKKHSKIPVTVVVADDIIYMGRENFHHWPLPRLQGLPPKESLEPPFSSVERKDITDVEQITMDPDQTCQVVMRFFKESVAEGESKYWSLTTELESHVQQLVKAIQSPWENMFETTLPINYK